MGSHQGNRRFFAIGLLIIEVIVIIFYGFFVRPKVHTDATENTQYYPMYQDINVMMLIGFGFLMTFVKSHAWSALAYTFFINAVVVQLYLLFQPFWHRVFEGGWDSTEIFLVENSFTGASYSVASVLIAFGAVLGKVGPLELLIMALVQIIGYTLNEHICYNEIKIFDAGGSTVIHTFGAYFGLTVSLILSKAVPVRTKAEASYHSNIFAFIGTLFLWMFWPSFNAGIFPTSPYERSVIVGNTIISLTGSCLGTFIMTALLREKFSMEDLLNATLAGGVAIGAPSGIFTNLAASLTVGLGAGVISTLGYRYLSEMLDNLIGLHDTCGVHNLHGIPGLIGGIVSAIAVASYASDPLENSTAIAGLPFYNANGISDLGRTFYEQGGSQIAGTFVSLGMGVAFGVIAGFLMRLVYVFESKEFFRDDLYFQGVEPEQEHLKVNMDDTLGGTKDREMQKVKLPPIASSDTRLN